jgi:hypothetical protein
MTTEDEKNELHYKLACPDVGQDETTLKKYNLDHAKVITAAERTQERTQSFRARGIHGLESLFQGFIDKPGDDLDLTYFNVPVCDLDTLGDVFGDYNCGDINPSERGRKYCVVRSISSACRRLKIGDSEWPYQ